MCLWFHCKICALLCHLSSSFTKQLKKLTSSWCWNYTPWSSRHTDREDGGLSLTCISNGGQVHKAPTENDSIAKQTQGTLTNRSNRYAKSLRFRCEICALHWGLNPWPLCLCHVNPWPLCLCHVNSWPLCLCHVKTNVRSFKPVLNWANVCSQT